MLFNHLVDATIHWWEVAYSHHDETGIFINQSFVQEHITRCRIYGVSKKDLRVFNGGIMDGLCYIPVHQINKIEITDERREMWCKYDYIFKCLQELAERSNELKKMADKQCSMLNKVLEEAVLQSNDFYGSLGKTLDEMAEITKPL